MIETVSPPWLSDAAVQVILHRLIDMTDQQPMSKRTRPPGFRLTPQTVPAFFERETSDDVAFAWSLVKLLADMGWIRVQQNKPKPGYADYELEPRLLLVPDAETQVREALSRPAGGVSDAEQWRAAVAAQVWAGDVTLLARQPVRVEGLSDADVVRRLQRVPELAERFYLREISAYLFQGLSKVLDGRLEALQMAFGSDVPLREKPILINVSLPEAALLGVLFVENEATYHALRRAALAPLAGLALVWSSGFMAAAGRIRQPEGATLHFSDTAPDVARARFEALWRDSTAVLPMSFFGDLDFSGMAILKQMRQVFPNLIAWEPGYRALLLYRRRWGGHSPEAADKVGQRDPGCTGCLFADTELLSALRGCGGFVDQEVLLPFLQEAP